MSQENVEIFRRAWEHFRTTGDLLSEIVHPDFVWDMSTFQGWPEQQTYQGIDGARAFLADWVEAWDDWELEIEELLDVDDKVVAIMHQHGRAKATGLPVDMNLAQVWTIRDGKEVRMEMYANPGDALEAAGLRDG